MYITGSIRYYCLCTVYIFLYSIKHKLVLKEKNIVTWACHLTPSGTST